VPEARLLVVGFDLRIPLWGKQHAKCVQAISHVHPNLFYKFRSSSNPTPEKLAALGLEIQTVLSQIIRRVFLQTNLCKSQLDAQYLCFIIE
jgi:hypothetical protein